MERADLELAAAANVRLRGLVLVPCGLLFAPKPLEHWDVGPFGEEWFSWAWSAVLVAMLVVIWRHYNGHYGKAQMIRPPSSTRSRFRGYLVMGLVFAILPFAFIDEPWCTPFNPFLIAVGVGLLRLFVAGNGAALDRHNAYISASMLLAGVLPVWAGMDRHASSAVGIGVTGAALVVIGLLNHRLLVRVCGPAKGLSRERGDISA